MAWWRTYRSCWPELYVSSNPSNVFDPTNIISDPGSHSAEVQAVLGHRRPKRIVYAPNYWQWFSHHQRHGTLPEELSGCDDQLDMIRHLGLAVFSRNIYCDQLRGWYGGLCEIDWQDVGMSETETADGDDLVIDRVFRTPAGDLTQRQRYRHNQSTLVEEKHIVDDYEMQLDRYEKLVAGRRWRFIPERYQRVRQRVGVDGVVIAGELHSPLKMLHYDMGPEAAIYLLMDYPERAAELMAMHESAQLDLVRQIAEAGCPAMMSMDNLDSAFHPPSYVENYSASFYEKASRICHEHGSTFFIHACGQQKANLKLIASLGVDGLEGVTSSPLGDVRIEEAMELTGDPFIITGGISAAETDRLQTRESVFTYVEHLFDRLRPYGHRFILAASCNTAFTTRWETLLHFRDAWREYGEL